jgi:carbamoyltransferase
MYILGVSCYYHDSAAALLDDGMLVAAAEEERFSRIKHDNGFPGQAIDFCLRQAGITAHDLDYVVFYEKPLVKLERILMTALGSYPRSWRSFGEAMIAWFDEKLWVKSTLMQKLGIGAHKILFTEHHMAHAASAFFSSPFEEAAILTIDGVGEWTTATMGSGRASWEAGGVNEITLTHEQRFPHSLGLLYSAFTAFLGFKVNSGEYKVMGMAPYGEPRYLDKIEKLFKVYPDGSFRVNMDYFSYHYSVEHTFNQRFVELFGKPRRPESEFFTTRTNPELLPNSPGMIENQYYADLAASIQLVTEETILSMAREVHRQTKSKRLCLAGGVALNSKANGRILKETPFEELFIQPAAGDSGGALGAALYIYHVVLGKSRYFVQEHNYWGQAHPDDQIRTFLESNGIAYSELQDNSLIEWVVDDLLEGKVIGWYQGRFEWGPRALGNRSILADPRRAEMKDIVNTKIKFREPFRPFAPVIPEDEVENYFDFSCNGAAYPARYMLLVEPIKEDKQEVIPAVNHLGTGRLQTVRSEWNPRYYDVVACFGQATGVPMLMNTSFNLRGEPIVNTPQNAWNTFSNSGIDTLVMGNCLVRK